MKKVVFCLLCFFTWPLSGAQNDYFLVVLVDAGHLDYSNSLSFLRTMVKHPSNGSKNGDVGHAWIYLKGKDWDLEGGHTGEFGIVQPKYFDEVLRRSLNGEANPIAYLAESLHDGQFQRGAGGHSPTFAAKIDLTKEQFEAMQDFIRRYDFEEYNLSRRQCVNFVEQIASIAGIALKTKVTLEIERQIQIGQSGYQLWADPSFASLTLASPDRLEESLVQLVKEGRASNALRWYRYWHKEPFLEKMGRWFENLIRFPRRLKKLKLLRVQRHSHNKHQNCRDITKHLPGQQNIDK